MRKGFCSVGGIGNIDVNPSSATETSSFHITAESVHQKIFYEDGESSFNQTIRNL